MTDQLFWILVLLAFIAMLAFVCWAASPKVDRFRDIAREARRQNTLPFHGSVVGRDWKAHAQQGHRF